MTKDLIICVLSSFNIVMFSFIGWNYEAFKKLNRYEASAKDLPNFDTLAWQIMDGFSSNESPVPTPDPTHKSAEQSVLISIPKLNLLAPVKISENTDESSSILDQGVLSLRPFITPGSPGQNILFGHSSDYPWKNNPFGTVFTLLPKLESGDEIIITQNNQIIRYKVKHTQITDSQLSGLIRSTSEHELILSTCYPIGFFNKRFNVIATPIITNTAS